MMLVSFPNARHVYVSSTKFRAQREPSHGLLDKSVTFKPFKANTPRTAIRCMTTEWPKNVVTTKPTKQALCDIWREVQGANSWDGLINPAINPVLKSELLRYGDMVHICYQAFDPVLSEKEHKFGGCRYPKTQLFENSLNGWAIKSGYEVSDYIYAETDGKWGNQVKQSVWMGYIAVCEDEKELKRLGRRDIVVAWRGTMTAKEWLKDFCISPAKIPTTLPFSVADNNIRIESGFLSTYTTFGQDRQCARDCLHKEITRLINTYEGKGYPLSITFVGHSLGAALATLGAYDVKESLNDFLQDIPVTVFGFGGPKVGNKHFAERVEKIGLKILRVENKNDIVPKTPWSFPVLHEWSYKHAGVDLVVDNLVSPYLKHRYPLCSWKLLRDVFSVHDSGVYFHLLDGHQGEGLPFGKARRDLRLVNFFNDMLRDELNVEACWGHGYCASKSQELVV